MIPSSERLIVALDFPHISGAREMVGQLAGLGVAFKVGLELYVAEGPKALDELRRAGAERFFLDLKFHDIPNTMVGAVRSAAALGVWMLNVHASAGRAALRRCAEDVAQAAEVSGASKPLLIAVTVLTSLDEGALRGDLGVVRGVQEQVTALARLSQECGLDGVVAPAPDAALIRQACGEAFCIVSPGIRPRGADVNDQARIDTPSSALAGGASHLVVGRPVTQAKDPAQACEEILREMSEALA